MPIPTSETSPNGPSETEGSFSFDLDDEVPERRAALTSRPSLEIAIAAHNQLSNYRAYGERKSKVYDAAAAFMNSMDPLLRSLASAQKDDGPFDLGSHKYEVTRRDGLSSGLLVVVATEQGPKALGSISSLETSRGITQGGVDEYEELLFDVLDELADRANGESAEPQ